MAITFGNSGAPSQKTINLDSLFTLSLANVQRTLVDQISTSNPIFAKLVASDAYQSVDGGTNIEIPLMYQLGEADWFEGYDTLKTDPMDGHTMSVWEWREASIPIVISHREERQNAQKIAGLLEAKIEQAEMGFRETMAKALLQGSLSTGSGSSIETAVVSSATGASGMIPLANLIQLDPTSSESVGNINQSTFSWWRNQTKSSTASTYDGFLKEVTNVYNSCSKGPGGPPDMILCDQSTFEMFEFALYNRGGSRAPEKTNLSFPFENIKYRNSMVTWDEFMPDVENDSLTLTTGSMYFLNTKFLKLKYDSQTNFTNTPFASAPNQPNAKVSHIMWMGQLCCSNRRKQGVLYGIDTTIAS